MNACSPLLRRQPFWTPRWLDLGAIKVLLHHRPRLQHACSFSTPPSATATTAGWSSSRQQRRPSTAADSHIPSRSEIKVSTSRSYSTSRRHQRPGSAVEQAAPSFAFAFDIDGVLLHVAKPIPGASKALRFLHDHHIPFILLTNGGGKHEADRVADLSRVLGVPLTTDNFVQSHTPFRELARAVDEGDEGCDEKTTTTTTTTTLANHNDDATGGSGESDFLSKGKGSLRDKTILVTGSHAHKAREIAEHYGFRDVVIPADILAAHPTIFPFDPLLESVYKSTARPLRKPLLLLGDDHHADDGSTTYAKEKALKIDAVFVFNDPRDWALDIQIITDLLLSHRGYLGTYSPLNGRRRGWQNDGQPTLYFSNKDLFWAAHWRLPRLGQGSFQAALAGVWDEITGGASPLRREVIGKPFAATYRYAERVLERHRLEVLGRGRRTTTRRRGGSAREQQQQQQSSGHNHSHDHGHSSGSGSGSGSRSGSSGPGLRSVYMVGDNPDSDIAGANAYRSDSGAEWNSVLVRTGVWRPERSGGGEGEGEMRHRPKVIVDDVLEAVRWALKREGWDGGCMP